MKKLILLLLVLFSINSFGQEVKNVNFEQSDDKIIIYYDLIGNDLFDVSCFYSIDGGIIYIELKSVTGDVGMCINNGKAKQIAWDIFKDTDGIKSEIQFKIEVKEIKNLEDQYKKKRTWYPILISPYTKLYKSYGINIVGFSRYYEARGLNFSFLYSRFDSIGYGTNAAPFMENKGTLTGINFGAVILSEGTLNGLNACPPLFGSLFIKTKNSNGINIAAVNIVTNKHKGVMFGVVNYAKELHGVQFGLLNSAMNNRFIKWFPIINWHK